MYFYLWNYLIVYNQLPEKAFTTVIFSFMTIAASTIVNRGAVNIKVIASDTGMNFTHANDVSIIRLPFSPRTHSMILWYTDVGQNVSPKFRNLLDYTHMPMRRNIMQKIFHRMQIIYVAEIPFMNNISDKRGIWMMLLTAMISPKLSLAALITKLLAVKKRPDKKAMLHPKNWRAIRPRILS